MAAPFAVCLILTGIHCYLGLHVVTLLFGYELSSIQAYIFSLLFTFVGAGIFALSRFREKVVSQEAIIGIVYAVFSVVTCFGAALILSAGISILQKSL